MPTLLGAHFGHPSGGFFLFSDFFIRDCQLPLSLKTFGFGPGLALGRESTLGLTFFHLLGSLHFRLLVHEPPPWGGELFLPTCYQEHYAANEGHCACDGR